MKSRCLSPSSRRSGWRSLPVLAGLGALLLAGPLGCAARTGVDPVAGARPAAPAAEPAAPAMPMMRMPPPPPPVVVSDAAPGNGGHGVLIMAHGGGEVWNETVIEAAADARHEGPVVVAFGMAHPVSMQQGVDTLDELGAERVSVVRLFVSGESFRTDTRYLLGLSEEGPELPWVKAPLEHDLEIATHERGLMGSPEVSQILLTRALALSRDPAGESVLLIAHGMGDEGENDRVLDSMRLAAGRIAEVGFREVEVAALREDWEEARVTAEAAIRSFVESRAAAGRRVLVLPYRLSGFGPYAKVLQGLDYAAGDGLLPHDAISRWIERTAAGVACERGWRRRGCDRFTDGPR